MKETKVVRVFKNKVGFKCLVGFSFITVQVSIDKKNFGQGKVILFYNFRKPFSHSLRSLQSLDSFLGFLPAHTSNIKF